MPTVNMIEYLDRMSCHIIYAQGYVVQKVVQTSLSQCYISLELPEQLKAIPVIKDFTGTM